MIDKSKFDKTMKEMIENEIISSNYEQIIELWREKNIDCKYFVEAITIYSQYAFTGKEFNFNDKDCSHECEKIKLSERVEGLGYFCPECGEIFPF